MSKKKVEIKKLKKIYSSMTLFIGKKNLTVVFDNAY